MKKDISNFFKFFLLNLLIIASLLCLWIVSIYLWEEKFWIQASANQYFLWIITFVFSYIFYPFIVWKKIKTTFKHNFHSFSFDEKIYFLFLSIIFGSLLFLIFWNLKNYLNIETFFTNIFWHQFNFLYMYFFIPIFLFIFIEAIVLKIKKLNFSSSKKEFAYIFVELFSIFSVIFYYLIHWIIKFLD